MTHVQKPYEFPHALWVRLAQLAPEPHGTPRNPVEPHGTPCRNPMEILTGIATTRRKIRPTSAGTGRFLSAPPVDGTYMYIYTWHRGLPHTRNAALAASSFLAVTATAPPRSQGGMSRDGENASGIAARPLPTDMPPHWGSQ